MPTLYEIINGKPEQFGGGGGTSSYNDLENKPQINGRTLQGNKTLSDLGIFSGNYNDLGNKPDIFGSAAAYSSSTSYTVGTFVTYNNTLYVCIKATSGNDPTNTTYWAKCDLTNIGGVRLGIDGDGNRGYYGADGSLIPFKSIPYLEFTNTLKDILSSSPKYTQPIYMSYLKDKKIKIMASSTNTNAKITVYKYTEGSYTPSTAIKEFSVPTLQPGVFQTIDLNDAAIVNAELVVCKVSNGNGSTKITYTVTVS